jgi:hypothetical protein
MRTVAGTIGLIAAVFMLAFMIIGALLADIIRRRTILLIAAVVFLGAYVGPSSSDRHLCAPNRTRAPGRGFSAS